MSDDIASPNPEAELVSLRDSFMVFGVPAIGAEEFDEVAATLNSGWLGTGPRVHRFEEAFRAYKGAAHAVGCNSCTAALHLSLMVSGLKPGDEVITTPMTFCATINAIIHAGATPVLVDVDPVTLNIDPTRVEAAITSRTRVLLPVHLAGLPCRMDLLTDIARRHGLKLIEDCAHAIETEFAGKKAGTFGDFGCFSFYVSKNITTGEGGMVLVRAPEDEKRVRCLSLHGLSRDAWNRFGREGYRHYQVEEAGFKYNMMDLQAAMGIHQLARVESNWERRRVIWQRYQQAFADLPVRRPVEAPEGSRHGYHLYAVRIDPEATGWQRDQLLARMIQQKIGTGVHYVSIPDHPYYQRTFGWSPDDWPVARDAGRTTLTLPLSPAMSDADVEQVILAFRRALRH
ncbi:MAG: DegT/DnrJ/EryC1/StrS family aminotransferase [Magnetococcales bacterium]|nr:DegT/DnrJ/EryC1/StrS family aminotransferase [Magnetococcales bacterium]